MKGMYLGRRFYRQMFGLVIDTGTTIVGMTRLIECEGVGGSFNGNRHGLHHTTLFYDTSEPKQRDTCTPKPCDVDSFYDPSTNPRLMHQLISTATAELAAFLAKHLPALGAAWWKTHVEDRLSFQQQRTVKDRGFTTLEQLDFAALLRTLDQNWYELSQALTLPREGRTWVRELQSVRNRWAHLSAAPMPPGDLYRDTDTLARVFQMLDAAPDSIAAVEAVKRNALSGMMSPSDAAVNSTNRPTNSPMHHP